MQSILKESIRSIWKQGWQLPHVCVMLCSAGVMVQHSYQVSIQQLWLEQYSKIYSETPQRASHQRMDAVISGYELVS